MIRLVQRGTAADIPGYPPFISSLLNARGVNTPKEAESFLSPEKQPLCDPFDMPGMREAVTYLLNAREMKTPTVIYGDYDCDGVCASAIMLHTLRALGIPAEVMLPDRHGDGYGLNRKAVEEIASRCSLLITVDNGITAVEEIRLAKQLGLRVIVTDHHRPHAELPEADVIICSSMEGYPCPYLCGAGVAFQVSRAVLGDRALHLLDLCALATIADMVPLLGENRTLAALGMKAIENTTRPGLRALIRVCELKNSIGSHDVGFSLSPRINACGRMDSAYLALDLLMAEDEQTASELAVRTQALNDRRREEEERILLSAREKVKELDLVSLRAVTVWDESWDIGVCGLAAGKLADETGYPTVVLSCKDGVLTGSARSAGGVDIHAALAECEALLTRFGGHRQAAGMTLPAENAEKFRQALSDAVFRQVNGQALAPVKEYDAEIRLPDITLQNIALLEKMEPFGMGNPEPLFLIREARVQTAGRVGADGKHLRGSYLQDGAERTGIGFFLGGQLDDLAEKVDMLVFPCKNTFNGLTSPEMQVRQIMNSASAKVTDPARELDAFVRDLEKLLDRDPFSPAQRSADRDPASFGQIPQGAAVLCRTAESAARAEKQYPGFERMNFSAADPRAYNAVLYACTAEQVSPAYRELLLFDGELLPGEAEMLREKFPAVYVGESGLLSHCFSGLRLNKEELRRVYRAASRGEMTLQAVAAAAEVTLPQALSGLRILSRMELLRFDAYPFRIMMLPVRRCEPEDDRLFRFLAGKEQHG